MNTPVAAVAAYSTVATVAVTYIAAAFVAPAFIIVIIAAATTDVADAVDDTFKKN